MKNFIYNSTIWIRITCISILLSGCSLLPNSQVEVQKKDNIDYWSDSSGSWENWDENHPSNELVAWTYDKDGIQVNFVARPELNIFGQRSHTLVVKIVQLSEVSGINTLFQTNEGIAAALTQETEMIPNAIFSESFVLGPKQNLMFRLARQENAKYIAIIAGFAELDRRQAVRIIPISVNTTLQEPIDAEWTTLDKMTFGYFVSKEPQPDILRPSNIRLNIDFGENSITKFSATAE
ncbi:hypothetical protein Ping_0014 [Psychromonas ingrahamii 37]|uniref:Lipoprotein n=1 Tax=Psychromonas ingrahamii (strain DSM 17664 / CCUG 51855 / 37) TaxID=357804 RepID=A1SQX4_PSYIN|nr:type VI secretion lipoprotein TssJ [Psychromonas ingrahamii]ABM01889.1 hypothetical protein Ping_0014 [Psychromonas ingrahamii 37]